MLGYCPECDRLTAIRPKRRFEGGCLDYVTIAHDTSAPLCEGSGTSNSAGRYDLIQQLTVIRCVVCDEEWNFRIGSTLPDHLPFLEGQRTVMRRICPGSGKVVK